MIKKENEKDFREVIGDRIAKIIEVEYAFQDVDDIPEGFQVPEGREKPWGTGHAVLSSRKIVDGPFVVINADDYYGKSAFSQIYDYLTTHEDGEKYNYVMVGYVLENTLTENGHVARGVCTTDENSRLSGITERTRIEKKGEETAYTEDGGATLACNPRRKYCVYEPVGIYGELYEGTGSRVCPVFGKRVKGEPVKMRVFSPQRGEWAVGEQKGRSYRVKVL